MITILKKFGRQVLLVEGVFLGLYGNWFIDITKVLDLDFLDITLYSISILTLFQAFIMIIKNPRLAYFFIIVHVLTILYASMGAMKSGKIPEFFWIQGLLLIHCVFVFGWQSLDFN